MYSPLIVLCCPRRCLCLRLRGCGAFHGTRPRERRVSLTAFHAFQHFTPNHAVGGCFTHAEARPELCLLLCILHKGQKFGPSRHLSVVHPPSAIACDCLFAPQFGIHSAFASTQITRATSCGSNAEASQRSKRRHASQPAFAAGCGVAPRVLRRRFGAWIQRRPSSATWFSITAHGVT